MARVCVVRQYYYPLDIRVRREVEALLTAGHEVDVVCLRGADEPLFEREGRLRVRRLPLRHRRGGGAAGYASRYGTFLVLAAAVVLALHLRRRYALVQVHSLPDPLVLVGLLPRLLGARLLLDLHETMPEFAATKFGLPLSDPRVRLVIRAEQWSIRVADEVLTCTEQMREAFVARGARREKITVVLNSADESVFDVQRYPPAPVPDRFTLVCHGSIEERYGLDTVVEALALLPDLPEITFEVFGDGEFRSEIVDLARLRGVADRVHLSEGFVPMPDLLDAISRAHVGVVAMKQDAFRDLTHCNKMYEFLAMRVPVVTSRTRSVAAYFPESAVEYFRPGDAADLARVIRRLYEDPDRRRALVVGGTTAVQPYRWAHQRRLYLAVVERLMAAARPSR